MSPEPEPHRERWEVFQQPDGHWRWRWLPSAEESDEADPIVSGETFERAEEAEESARSAYPDLEPASSEAAPATEAAHRKRRLGVALVAALLVTGYLAGRRGRLSAGYGTGREQVRAALAGLGSSSAPDASRRR